MEKAIISVVVPIYNTEKYLEKCLESIINQSCEDFQIVLVDDGSTDESGKICDVFAGRDKRIKVVHQKNQGLVRARKVGLEEAEGDYVYYVDSDDWLDKNVIETFMNIILKFQVDIVSVGIKREYGGGKIQIDPVSFKDGFYNKKDIKEKIIPKLINTNKFFEWGQHLTYWHYLIRKNVLYENQRKVSDHIRMAEDIICVFPCILDANSMYICSDVYYHYRQRSDSMKWIEQEDEYKNLQLASCILVKKFSMEKEKDILLKKVKYLMLFELLTSVPSTVLFKDGTFPYVDFPAKSKVAVYGAGLFGCKIVSALQKKKYADIVVWVDSNFASCQVENFEVAPPEKLKEVDYDYVIISVIRADIREKIIQSLTSFGVAAEKIVDFDLDKIDRMSLPKGFELQGVGE